MRLFYNNSTPHQYMKRLLFFLTLLIVCGGCGRHHSPAPTALRCEYRYNPIGIDIQKPRLTWEMSDTVRGARQTAYQIMVATTPELLEKERPNIWNSGKVRSAQSVLVPYGGPALESGKRYYWTVRVWNEDNVKTDYSQPAFWEMGKLSRGDWQAQWIGLRDTISDMTVRFPSCRSLSYYKRFTVPADKKVQSARAYMTALGGYTFDMNGERVNREFFSPGWTNYAKRIQYVTYDISDRIQNGENIISGMLGNLWTYGFKKNFDNEMTLRMFGQVEITYSDGSKQVIATDTSWKMAPSAITFNTFYDGETYDARIDMTDYDNDIKWVNARYLPNFNVELDAQNDEPVKAHEELKPVEINKLPNGDYVLNIGQNIAGVYRLKVKGTAGQMITLRFAEVLHEDGSVAQENLRYAKATDNYICKGTGELEEYVPTFTFHGYQYVQISGLKEAPTAETFTAIATYSDMEFLGEFECSNNLINKFYQNTKWGHKGNFISVATDCPQRDERLGWLGDAQVFMPTANYNARTGGFLTKWTRDMRDSQTPEGYVTDIAPPMDWVSVAAPAWGDAVTLIPWELYRSTGDKGILEQNYNLMKGWVDFMIHESKDNLYIFESRKRPGDYGYGDWVPVDMSPSRPLSQIYFHVSTEILSKAADILGKRDDAAYYKALLPKIAEMFHKTYFEEEAQNYVGHTQCANVLPYWFGLVPDEWKEKTLQNIIDNVVAKNYHPTTGFYATAYLLPILSETGHHDMAWKLASQRTYPSWLYMVEHGATTIWELWNSDQEPPESMNSRNHYAYGTVVAWYYGYLAGIRPIEKTPGYKKFTIDPMPADGLQYVKATVPSEYGLIKSAWTHDGKQYTFDMTIPANTTANVSVPVTEKSQVSESGKVLIDNGKRKSGNKYVKPLKIENGRAYFEVAAGEYQFTINN